MNPLDIQELEDRTHEECEQVLQAAAEETRTHKRDYMRQYETSPAWRQYYAEYYQTHKRAILDYRLKWQKDHRAQINARSQSRRHFADEGTCPSREGETRTHTSEVIHMKIVTINLPESFLNALEKLCEHGLYPSRSEALRVALRDFLAKELQIAQKFKEISNEVKAEDQALLAAVAGVK